MIILRQNTYSWKDVLLKSGKDIIRNINSEVNSDSVPTENFFGTLVIDWWIDKSRYINKYKIYDVKPDDYSVEAFDKNSIIGWDLSNKFEPTKDYSNFKRLTISGIAKDNEYLDAVLINKQGIKIEGKVIVEIKK